MTYRLSKLPSIAAVAGLMALALTLGTCVSPWSPVAGATAGAASADNPSNNAYFPLVVGSKWTYKYTSGSLLGSTFTVDVLSAHHVAGGEGVDMRFGTTSGTFVSAQYTIESNGSIEVQGSFGGSKTSGTFSGSESYYIPTVTQVTTCKPCHFSGTGTETVSGTSVEEHIDETVTSIGAHKLTVPAGSYTAEELRMLLVVTSTVSGVATTDTIDYDLYLAKNVGMVESSAATVSFTVVGHTESVTTGAEQLVKYTT